MTEPQWLRAKQLFHDALERPEAERATFIAACDDEQLRAQVRALLSAHEEAGDFLEPEGPGSRIGRYKLLQSIGEGGFGEVYMADQEEPIRRRVALKIIKLGMDTKEVIARFEAERQALAMMDHPNIAKVLDAGATESGRPYFVMELVRGVPITEYCDTNRLDTRERLELFVDVCRAVHHAHEKGIIHRDIKPSNVLVTLHDGTPVPVVIDFGIAKATNQRLTEKTLFTAFGQFIGTPTYMSPEQAALSNEEVDRRSDVYSLGVLLYELLTGTTPLEADSLRSAAFVEMLRLIREVDPPTPSDRLRTLGERVNEIASRRRAEPGALAKLLCGDLDWIALHAMEKDRRRRYPSAAEFAADVERYFRHEPVSARQPSGAYRLRKFAKRHRRALFATAAIVSAALLGGALGERGPFAHAATTPAAPSRRLAWDSAARFDAGRTQPDGEHRLRYDPGSRGFQLIDLQTQKTRLLTSDGPDSAQGYPRDPLISPDGRYIAAMMLPTKSGGWDHAELRLFAASGAGPGRRVAEWNGPIPYATVFAFSPRQDVLWVWVMRDDDTADIAAVNVADGGIRVLKRFSNRRHTQQPSLSPDGRFIAYSDADTPAAPPDIFIMPTSGGSAVRIQHPARDWLPVFAPDGSGIVFISNRDGQSDVWFQPLTDGRPVGEARKVWARAAPYGTTESFGQNGSLFYYFASNGLEIYTVNVDLQHHSVGASEHITARPPDQNTAPQFSPDGQVLAHLRGAHRLVLRRLATGEEREYPLPTSAYAQTVDYCPDGRALLVGAVKETRPVALRVNVERGGVEEVELSPRAVRQALRPVCLGDDAVFVRHGTNDSAVIVRRGLGSGKETVLYRGLSEGLLYRSPKGDRFAFTVRTDSERVFVMPTAGGSPKSVASAGLYRIGPGTFSEIQGVMWMPDGHDLLLARSRVLTSQSTPVDSPEVTLWRVPIDGGSASEMARMNLPAYKGGIWGAMDYTMHPSGNRIAFLRSSGFIAQEWAIDNLLQFIQSGKTLDVPVQP